MSKAANNNIVIQLPKWDIMGGLRRILGEAKAHISPRSMLTIVPRQEFTGVEFVGSYGNEFKWSEIPWRAYSNPIVFSNLQLRASVLSSVVPRVQEKSPDTPETWVDIGDHPFETVFNNPNPIMSKDFLMRYQSDQLGIFGEAYTLLVPNLAGQLFQMWPVPACRINPIPHPKFGIVGYEYESFFTDNTIQLHPKYVCYHRHQNPFSYYAGFSQIIAAMIGVDTYAEMQKMDRDDIANGLNIQQIINVPDDTADVETVRAELNQGVYEGRRFHVINTGELGVTNVSAPRKGDYTTAIRELSTTEIDRVQGVPPGLWDQNANRSNSESGYAVFVNITMHPEARMISEDMSRAIRPWYPNENIRVIFDDFRIENREMALKEKEDRRVTQTYDEARKAEGDPPHPNPVIGNAPVSAAPRIAEILAQQGASILGSVVEEITEENKTFDVIQVIDDIINDFKAVRDNGNGYSKVVLP
jgi:hypothetical protein